MAAHIAIDCPHCLTQKAGFSGISFCPSPQGQTTNFIMLLQCQICGEGIVAKFRAPNPSYMQNWVAGSTGQGNTALLNYWPRSKGTKAPGHLPENIERFYLQGLDNLTRKNFDAAGTMFRKSLDTALKHLDPSGKGTLKQRIDNLPESVGITRAMKDWAHEIRELGNDAAHEEDPFTDEEANTLQAFTELFLTYTFTLPGMLAARKPSPA